MPGGHKATPLELMGIRHKEVSDRLKQVEADLYALQGAKQVLEDMLTELIGSAQLDPAVGPDGTMFEVPDELKP